MRRKRCSQECVRSTTQRRARMPASRASCSSPRERMCAVKPNSSASARLGVVVAAVEAERLRPLLAWLRPLDRDRLDRGADELVVVYVRARGRDPERDALTLSEERSFRPFCSIRRIRARVLPAQRRLAERAVHRQPLPLEPGSLPSGIGSKCWRGPAAPGSPARAASSWTAASSSGSAPGSSGWAGLAFSASLSENQ